MPTLPNLPAITCYVHYTGHPEVGPVKTTIKRRDSDYYAVTIHRDELYRLRANYASQVLQWISSSPFNVQAGNPPTFWIRESFFYAAQEAVNALHEHLEGRP